MFISGFSLQFQDDQHLGETKNLLQVQGECFEFNCKEMRLENVGPKDRCGWKMELLVRNSQ